MKEFLWSWLFWISLVFCSILCTGLVAAFVLFSTAPNNPHTPIFAAGFAFTFGFLGLGALTFFFFDKISRKMDTTPDVDGEFFKKVVKEMPFFFFSLSYFFALAIYMAIFLLMLPYIKNACL